MKSFVRIAITVIAIILVMAAVGAFWIWRTLYPKPLPANPWEVPAIKIPGSPPSPTAP